VRALALDPLSSVYYGVKYGVFISVKSPRGRHNNARVFANYTTLYKLHCAEMVDRCSIVREKSNGFIAIIIIIIIFKTETVVSNTYYIIIITQT